MEPDLADVGLCSEVKKITNKIRDRRQASEVTIAKKSLLPYFQGSPKGEMASGEKGVGQGGSVRVAARHRVG
ncbi:hypothetical protein GCM10025859_18300 [Alicyclobacillus fastidiosus]|nr:hypothetical protein GCM10025859_18300 [Alicyclobacillus fastidiosus]